MCGGELGVEQASPQGYYNKQGGRSHLTQPASSLHPPLSLSLHTHSRQQEGLSPFYVQPLYNKEGGGPGTVVIGGCAGWLRLEEPAQTPLSPVSES